MASKLLFIIIIMHIQAVVCLVFSCCYVMVVVNLSFVILCSYAVFKHSVDRIVSDGY